MTALQRLTRGVLPLLSLVFGATLLSTLLQTDTSTIPASPPRRRSLQVVPPLLNRNCPPKGFDARPEFDIDEYIRALWYPQRAAPVIYARSQSYCSVVRYTRDDEERSWWQPDRPRIDVRNRGLDGGVDGDLNDARIKAFVPEPEAHPARIQVGFPQGFVTVWLGRSNYWVVAAGTYASALAYNVTDNDDTTYEWALISGGPPRRETDDGKCIAGRESGLSLLGLWIFTRDPFPPAGVVENVTAYADEELGLETSTLIANIHEGCTYDFLEDDDIL